jgi:eukaryotic-like serine/threonine-protein kinase
MPVCPSCSSPNDDETRFCTECGTSLRASQPAGIQGSPIAAVGVAGPTPTPGASGARISSHPAPGMLIDGKYAIEKTLGEGAMGVVYLAHDVVTETKVVVKSIRTEYTGNAEFWARAIEEGRVLARIDHPNVVRLNAVVVEGGQLYLVMQYIEGNSLDRLIESYRREGKVVPLEEAMRIFRMMVQGVAAAHHEGVIHRDLKPANILVRAKDGVIKVSDFGIAKTGDAIRTGRQRTVGTVGSPAYMAPEQRAGVHDLDRRADIYALGIVLFELLVGDLPFVAATEAELFRLHTEAAFPSVRTKRPDLPAALDEIIARACAKDRRDRFSTCEELDAALVQAGLHTMRSVPPTVMATQGLPSVPPPAPDAPRGSSTSRVARTLSDAPLAGAPVPGAPLPSAHPSGPPLPGSSVPPFVALPSSAAPGRSVWKVVALVSGLAVLLAGAGLGWAFATGVFDEPGSPLVEPPKPRDAGGAKSASDAAARADGGKPSR